MGSRSDSNNETMTAKVTMSTTIPSCYPCFYTTTCPRHILPAKNYIYIWWSMPSMVRGVTIAGVYLIYCLYINVLLMATSSSLCCLFFSLFFINSLCTYIPNHCYTKKKPFRKASHHEKLNKKKNAFDVFVWII